MIFLNDRVEIADNTQTVHFIIYALLISSLFLGLSYILENSWANHPTLFVMGIMIVTTSGLAIIFMLTRSVCKALPYGEIDRIKLRKNYNGEYAANIKIKKGRVRYIALNRDPGAFDLFVTKSREHAIRLDMID